MTDLKPDGNIHVIPEDDCIVHFESSMCSCSPKKEYTDAVTDNQVWVHKRFLDKENIYTSSARFLPNSKFHHQTLAQLSKKSYKINNKNTFVVKTLK